MNQEQLQIVTRFNVVPKYIDGAGENLSSKGNAAFSYSLIFPDRCIAVLGGKFNVETSSPYKAIIFTPVGCYMYDTCMNDHPRFTPKRRAMELVKIWNGLEHKPHLVPFRKLCELLSQYETWGGNSYLAKILKSNPGLPISPT